MGTTGVEDTHSVADNRTELESTTPVKLPWYRFRSPVVQNVIVSIILAMTPGIYLALTGLGAGGGKPTSATFANQVNVILYSIFFFACIVAGPCVNMFGPRLCLAFGTTGYAVYVGGLWYFGNTGHLGFPLFGGAYLGVTAGFLWVVAGYTCQAYAPENRKAMYVAQQWSIVCLGSVLGAGISLAVNIHQTKPLGVGNAVYGAFVGIHVLAGILALILVVDPRTVRRNDGTHLAVFPPATIKHEIQGLWLALKDPRLTMFLLTGFAFDLWLPIIGSWNSYTFSLRARSLNTFLFNLIQIPATFFFQWIVSTSLIKSRRKRIGAVLTWTLIINVAGWGSWVAYLKKHNQSRNIPGPALDWTMKEWREPFGIYIVLAIMAPALRILSQYMCAIAANDPSTQARYGGLMHAMPQAGLAVAFGTDSTKPRFLTEAAAFFGISIVSILLAYLGTWIYVPETLYGLEENVIVPTKEAHELGLDHPEHKVGVDEMEDKAVEAGGPHTTVGIAPARSR